MVNLVLLIFTKFLYDIKLSDELTVIRMLKQFDKSGIRTRVSIAWRGVPD